MEGAGRAAVAATGCEEAAAEADAEASLFSLELLVESARVEPRLLPAPLPVCGPFRPAVALRLLDFPTLLVRGPPHAGPGPVLPFGRGKSCLFRLRPAALRGLLRRSPLYALVLALPPTPGPARLLGSCSVSLAAAAEELLLGTGPGGRRGRFPLQDLMGEQVGELGLSYRLIHLGLSLQGHLGDGAAPPPPRKKPHHPPPRTQDSLRGASLELIPETDEDQELPRESGSPWREPCDRLPGLGELAGELEVEGNVFCPPPMFYSGPAENSSPPTSPATAVVTVAPAVDSSASSPAEEIQAPSPVALVEKAAFSTIQEVPPSPQIQGTSEQLRQTLNQLPLLNALLVELSLLSTQPVQAQPPSVHPQLAWLYKNAEEGTKAAHPVPKSVSPYREDKKTTHRKERGRSPSPKLKRNRADHSKCIPPSSQGPGKGFTKLVYSERLGSPEKNNTKENSPPRRKLTYGLTNTLKLRLLQSNPGVLNVHDKREHRRKKGDVLVEKKGKSSSSKGKVLHGSPENRSKSCGRSDENSLPHENPQFNENVETLIQNSACQDCPRSKKGSGEAVKNNKNEKQKTSTEMVSSFCKEKSLKVHLPRVSLQDTETCETRIDTEVVKYGQRSDSVSIIYDSQKNNCESSHEVKNLEEVVTNSMNTTYSEDFTSIDTNLEVQESSSETLLVNLDRSQSITDSYSKMYESLADENISPLLPLSLAMSPVQDLKKTLNLESNKIEAAVTYDTPIDDSPPARTLNKENAIEESRKERIRDQQALENKKECSDMKYTIEKDQSSSEKSNSLRTSQISSYLPSNASELEFSGLEESNTSEKEKKDVFEIVDIATQCKHISELVVNKLPGYTM